MKLREGWIHEKFGEVFDLQMGRTPARKNPAYWQNGKHSWVAISDLKDDRYISETKEKVSDTALEEINMRLVPEGTVIMSFKLSIGKTAITQTDLYTNEAIMAFHTNEGYEIDTVFLYYYLRSYKWSDANKAVMGITLNKTTISNHYITIPPLETQHQIVAELDALNSIIDKKKEQLKELDNLAQATFYDMFGDPVVNEKEWEKKKLKETADLINGRAYKRDELLDKGKTPVLRVGNFFTSNKFYYSDLELPPDKYCDFGDLLFAWSASFGAKIWDGGKVIFHYHIWKVDYKEEIYNKYFLLNLLNIVTHSLMNQMRGGIMLHLTKGAMEKTDFITPPLSLQTQFAQKIEQIENKKSLIQRSIDDVQQLFDYTMDKYFN